MGDRVDLDDLAVLARTVVLGKLAKGAFKFPHLWQQTTLNDDLAVCRDAHIIGLAFDDTQGLPMQGPGDLKFIPVYRPDRLRGEHGQRIHTNGDGDIERLLA